MTDVVRYRVNQPAVIGEVLDDEAIVVNLDSGAYYSLRGVGALVWQLVEKGGDNRTILSAVSQAYGRNADEIAAQLDSLLHEMVDEALLLAEDSTTPSDNSEGWNDLVAAAQGEYAPPVLEKYTDMADLLLLDPIHEVDGMGWPHPAPVNR